MLIMDKIAARQSNPVAIYAPIGPGNVHGTKAIGRDTKFRTIAKQVNAPFTIGVTINGIAKYGFKTIGNPKIIGSLMLKILGIITALPNVFPNEDLDKNANKIHRPKIVPEPPI